MWADDSVKCDYCHNQMSIIESITEYGKYYHQDCYIHKIGKEIEGYKKKWIDGKLSKGDKVELLDLWNLRENMIANKTEFKGFALVGETVTKRNVLTKEPLREALYEDRYGMIPVLDEDGNMKFKEDNSPSIEIRNAIMRPQVRKSPKKERKLITMEELPKLLGIQ